MNETQNACQKIEPLTGSCDAYRMGCSIEKLYGWAESIRWLKNRMPSAPWHWDFPFTVFDNRANRFSKRRFLDRISHSLRRISLLRTVDPVSVFEMHRLCEDFMESSADLAREFIHPSGTHLARQYRKFQKQLSCLKGSAEKLFDGQGKSLQIWFELGIVIGKSLRLHVFGDDCDTLPDVMAKLMHLGRKSLPETHISFDTVARLYDPEFRYIGIPGRLEPAGKMIAAISKMDKWIYTYLVASGSEKPYFVFDDSRRTITYFGTEIAFEEIPTDVNGGFKMVRVFAQFPGQSLSASQLTEACNLAVDAEQVPVYLSRFRSAFKKLILERKIDSIEYMPETKEANDCFIVADRRARARQIGKDTYYKLALPPERVKYIAPN